MIKSIFSRGLRTDASGYGLGWQLLKPWQIAVVMLFALKVPSAGAGIYSHSKLITDRICYNLRMETLPDHDKLLTDRALRCAATELNVDLSELRITPVSGSLTGVSVVGDRTIFVS